MTETLRVAMAGGGTGGHIIPALAIAEELQRRIGESTAFSEVQLLFFGSDYGMETRMIPDAGFELVALPIRSLSRSLNLRVSFTIQNYRDACSPPSVRPTNICVPFNPILRSAQGGMPVPYPYVSH
jgi:hypothetical protein